MRHGIERHWYKTGQLRYEHHWKDGRPDGIQRDWYKNGQLGLDDFWMSGYLFFAQRWDKNGCPEEVEYDEKNDN